MFRLATLRSPFSESREAHRASAKVRESHHNFGLHSLFVRSVPPGCQNRSDESEVQVEFNHRGSIVSEFRIADGRSEPDLDAAMSNSIINSPRGDLKKYGIKTRFPSSLVH